MCCFVHLLSYSMTDPRVRLNYLFPFQIVDEKRKRNNFIYFD